ncbi:MAG: amino acid adenylation domain-containing protein, partial [bacterium]|nr:amino acid adenylation domain-containing protein [bacterium]
MTNDKNIYSRAAFAAVEYGEEKEYWLNKFSGELKKTAFPYDHKQSPTFKRREETVTLKFSGKTSAKITQLSKGKDYRFHMTLAAGVVALLFRYTGENDIIIGSPVYKQEVEGEFINTILGLRNPVDDRVSFKELLLERIRPSILEANENQNYPVETLLNHLHITNPGTGFPLFDVAVLFESIHDKKYILHTEPGIIFSFSRVPDDGNDGDIVEVRVHYNSALYEPDTARRIARHYRNLMDTAVFNADTPVSRIDILSEAEKQQLLTDFNDTRRDYPSDKTIHDYFQTQASRVPNRTALTYEREPMTYEELDDESNALAAYLRSIGVETGEPVALMIEDSARGVVALLGILKAGAAYVPVNVAYPVERKKYILKDCNIKRLLINIEDPGEYDPSITVISMDDDEIYHFPVQATESAAVSGSQGSHSLAYIMYTSGSTGTPKGVMVEHRSVLRLVKNNGYFEFNEGDSILLTGALEFDASTFEIWGSLLNGLTLHMVSKATIIHHEKLKQAISLGEVTTMWMTSALFNQVLDADIKLFEGLKHLLVGGDVLSPLHINRLRKRFPGLTVINGYGPTENTTFSTTFTINRDYEQGIPIGKPIGNSTAYILDSHYQPVPIGVSGQLYVGGDGLSRGYLNKPQLTAEKFIDKSFTGGTGGQFFKSAPLSAGGRLYATGDLARWLEDGNIEFLGRIDHQVKIRGYRIEPGEVENCLMASGSIREAVVTDRVTRDGEKYLCAYVVPGNGGVSHFDGQQLRSLLSVRLPDYMVPSYFVPLEKIPLTVNGKVNRGALPEPEISGIGPAYKAPRNPMEEKIAETWSDVLKLEKEKIGIDADFFQMGGHSLNATMMTSRLHKAFHAKIPLVELFKNPTIRELAGYITGLETPGDHFDSISPVEQREYYPLSSAQKRVYVLHQMESGTTGYNIPMIMVLKGGPDRSRLRETFGALIRRHESLRTSFMTVNEIPAQRIHDSVEFEVGNKESGVDSKESNEEIINRFIRPFDLSQAPLMRAELVNTGDREHLFMIDMHHIITDGPSMELLVDEFLHAYARNPLPPLHLQYKDYTRWQNSKERQDAIRHQEDYWLKQFEGEPPVLELPHDYPRPTSRSFDGGDVTFELSPS